MKGEIFSFLAKKSRIIYAFFCQATDNKQKNYTKNSAHIMPPDTAGARTFLTGKMRHNFQMRGV